MHDDDTEVPCEFLGTTSAGLQGVPGPGPPEPALHTPGWGAPRRLQLLRPAEPPGGPPARPLSENARSLGDARTFSAQFRTPGEAERHAGLCSRPLALGFLACSPAPLGTSSSISTSAQCGSTSRTPPNAATGPWPSPLPVSHSRSPRRASLMSKSSGCSRRQRARQAPCSRPSCGRRRGTQRLCAGHCRVLTPETASGTHETLSVSGKDLGRGSAHRCRTFPPH